jgi:hypothetical protein
VSDIVEIVKILGGVAGIVALVWRFIDEFGTWIRISVKVSGLSDGWISALTMADNKGNRPKPIEFACLLVGPEDENPVETATTLATTLDLKVLINHTNDIEMLKNASCVPFYSNGRALLPLPFYYSENIDIADETLTYRAPIDTSKLNPGVAYSVRFFIFLKGRLHRSTHDSFFNKPPVPTA